MGANQSNEKSSLLKNFQYLVVEDKENAAAGRRQKQYKLMYFDYLNFLLYEIQHKAWKWDIYKEIVKQNGGSLTEDQRLFCGWKEIQKKIFERVKKELTGKSQKTYDWTKDAEPLIDIEKKKLSFTQDCTQFNINENDISELRDAQFPALSGGSSGNSCRNLQTASNLHIPLRRRSLLVKEIYDYLKDISEKITDKNSLKDVIQTQAKSQIYIGNAAIGLTKEMIEGLSTALSNLIKLKHNNDHTAFCKEWYRSMEDYHTLFLRNDIVDDNETEGIQCKIKLIETKVGNSTNFKQGWRNHFKKIVQDLQTTHFKDPTTKEPCKISYDEKTQCVRFFEEWAEEFCKLKKDLGNMIVTNCKDDNNANSPECKGVCTIYKKFLEESKKYYNNYKYTCDKTEYGYTGQDQKELRESFSKAAMNYMTECCKDSGHCDDTELFNVNNDKSNIRYNCMCEDGKHTKDRETKQQCSRYLTQTPVTGITVGPTSHGTSGQSVGTTGSNPKTVMDIAQHMQQEAKKQLDSRGTESSLKGNIQNAKFKNSNKGSDFDGDPCKMDKSKHTNDFRQYEDKSNPGNNKHNGPCTGKGGSNPDRFVIGKQWTPGDNEVDTSNKDVLLPPRRRDMCTSNLENLAAKGSTPELLTRSNVNDSFTGDVLLAAKEEANNIIELYKLKNDRNDQSGMCRAVRASFADLGDIIRGNDIWNKNDDMKRLEQHLVKIFDKIKTQLPDGNKYKNSDGKHTELRSDWWSANRDQVWGAIKCVVKDMYATTEATSDPKGVTGFASAYCGYNDSVPIDDYVPQKLRWLTEWNENYCKQLERHYRSVREKCTMCKNNEPCDINNENCDMCSKMCTVYGENVKKWKDQWQTQEQKYKELYTNGNNGNDKEFFEKLKKSGTTYEDAAEFIQSLGGYKYCNDTKQNKYKKSDEGKEEHVFHDKPNDFKDECGCKEKGGAPPAPGQPPRTVTRPKSQDITECEKTLGNGNPSSSSNNVTLSDWECVEDGNMCIDKSKNTHDIIKYSENFETIFNDWLDSFFKEQKNVKGKSEDCTSTVSNDCDGKNCRNKCPCYEKWVQRKNKEWKYFKKFYSEFPTIYPLAMTSKPSLKKPIDKYVEDKHKSELQTANSGNNNPTIDTILKEENTKVSECVTKCPIVLTCDQKGFANHWECDNKTAATTNTNMCTKTEDSDDPQASGGGSGGSKQPKNSDTTQLFYDSFNEWLHDMEQMLGTGKTLVEKTCGNMKMKTTSSSGSGGTSTGNEEKECTQCKDLCDCFKDLREKIEKQWGEQQNYYNQHKNNAKDDEMKKWDIHTYLNAQCIINEAVKTETPDSVQEDFDKIQGKCDNLKGQKQNYVEGILDNADKAKSVCDECENQTTPSTSQKNDCKDIGNADACRDKDFEGFENDKPTEKKPWLCKSDKSKSSEINAQVCVPSRTQPLCIANMYTSGSIVQDAFKDETKMKDALKAAIKKETKLLWDKNKGNPEKACRLTHRSLNDFKHMVIGDMLWILGSIKSIQEKIGEKIPTTSGKSREQWWKENEKDFWQAVTCGIQQSGGTTGDCPRFISDDDQFEWWAKEWSEDFYDKRNEVLKDFDTKCNTSGGTNDCDNNKRIGDCGTECEKYKTFLQKKRKEWKDNFEKYLKEHEEKLSKSQTSGIDQKEYSHPNVYLLYPCTYQNCDNKYMTALLSEKKPYGDKESTCTCKPDTQTTEDPCSGTYEHYGCSPKKFDKNIWSSLYVRHQTDRGKVYAPPRRNSMCIGWLFSPLDKSRGKMAAKNELRDKLIDAARGEAHYLWTYYNAKGGTTGQNSDYCKALTRSFYDYGDMVKGTDLWNAGYSPHVERNIKAVFSMPESGGTKPDEDQIAKDRQGWWDANKQYVWQAMNCSGNNSCSPTSGVPTDYESHDQFLRWFIEWGEHFCVEKTRYMETLRIKCLVDPCDSMCAGTTCPPCQKQCAKYHNWLLIKKKEFNGQKEKYKKEYKQKEEQRAKYKGVNKTPYEYLKTSVSECSQEDFKNVFKRHDEKYKPYKQKCKRCIDELTQDVVDKILTKSGKTSNRKTNIFWLCKGQCDVKNENLYEKHIQNEQDYTKIKGESNCEGLKKTAEDTNPGKGIKWDNTKGNFGHLSGKMPEDVYIPPRKQKICFKGLDGKYGIKDDSGVKDEDTLFKHLIKLSAIEGYNLGEYYKEKNAKKDDKKYSYQVSPCNAMKYSFLDLRDIILGHDMTEDNSAETEKNLETIFKKIYNEDDDKDAGNPGSTYRRNWWNQNQQCVWEAMKCGYKSGNTTLSGCDQPSETDYPVGTTRADGNHLQFLRWFAEWGEDYCGHYTREYDTLKTKCDQCTLTNGQCNKNSKECQECEKQCKAYTQFINDWKKQYDKQKDKFEREKSNPEYKKDPEAKEAKDARDFLDKKLKISCQNSIKPGVTTECNCMSDSSQSGSGDTPKSLEEIPSEYKSRCECDATSAAVKPATVTPTPPCEIVKEKLENHDGTSKIAECGKKDFSNKKWECENTNLLPKDGACMPPRRQTLCIHNLKVMHSERNSKTKDDLRKALIECASIETYWLWEKYKNDNKASNPQTELQKGNIPEGFKRIMMYTFGDFHDLIVGKDIGNSTDTKNIETTATDILAKPSGGPPPSGTPTTPDAWWNDVVAKDVWDAMVCALTSGITDPAVQKTLKDNHAFDKVFFDTTTGGSPTGGVTLSTFSGRPQFLRWMTEWGEQYCVTQAKEYEELKQGCNGYECNGKKGDKGKCEAACKKYKNFIETWTKHYESQNKKFKAEKSNSEYSVDNDAPSSQDARDYLHKKLQNMKCTKNGNTEPCKYNCMDDKSTQSGKTDMPKSLDEKPDIVKDKCPCPAAKPASTHTTPQGGNKSPSQPPGTVIQQDSGSPTGYNPDGGKVNVVISTTKDPAGQTTPTNGNPASAGTDPGSPQDPSSGADPQAGGGGGSGGVSPGGPAGGVPSVPGTVVVPQPGAGAKDPDLWDLIKNTAGAATGLGIYGTMKAIDTARTIIPEALEVAQGATEIVKEAALIAKDAVKTGLDVAEEAVKTGFEVAKEAVPYVLKELSEVTKSRPPPSAPNNSSLPGEPQPHPPSHPGGPPTTPQKNEPDITHNILSSTVPVGISVALGSIALLFYLKKKPKSSPVDLLRVIDIPQNDYNIPDETTTNRYIPYRSQYKGKTYIYVERDGDSEDDKYIFTSDTTDVTSSESEYEELDINDIYPYRSPKYKTLIEVVLKPRKSGDTPNSGDIPINKLTDEEWNELKHDFISQYLETIPKDVPNENIIDDNMYMEPNTTQDSMEEKPFITQIQDRKLYSDDSEIIYNIDWNIPKNITTNTATYNTLYSGIDLINDSLNSGNDIDIYDELLKRKENELYRTNHTKKTKINSFAKKTNSDPVLNQLDLFHKWLDRHRDMCNQWNSKEEMLHKLKDEWNQENNQHILDISSTHNDINRINDETHGMINENTHDGNDITSVEHHGSTNIPPNDLATQNNNFQTKNLVTNISMDIHFDENNNIQRDNDYLENSYNF